MQHSKPITSPWTIEEWETAHLTPPYPRQWVGAHHPHNFCFSHWIFFQMWLRLEAYMKCWGIAMFGAWISRPSRNVWSFPYTVCFSEQGLCLVQRCQTCLGSHKQLQNSACSYTWAYVCRQTEKPASGKTQHWCIWGHWRAVPREVPVPPRKQNIFRLERTDLIIFMICDSSAQMPSWRRDVLGEDCLLGSAVRGKGIF